VGRGAAAGRVELVERAGGDPQDLAAAELVPHLVERIGCQRQGLLPPC
jgi:hypothetical protein